MSDWEDFCESMNIDPCDPDQFDALLASWSREEERSWRNTSAEGGRADPGCSRCHGKGYIAKYRHIENGRCFKCFSGSLWKGGSGF